MTPLLVAIGCGKTISIPETYVGEYRLFIYSDMSSTFKQGSGELLRIDSDSISGRVTLDIDGSYKSSIVGSNESFYNPKRAFVLNKQSQDVVFLTVIDRTTRKVVHRGSYVASDLYNTMTSTEKSKYQLLQLTDCMHYWWDLYDSGKSPRKDPLPVSDVSYDPDINSEVQ